MIVGSITVMNKARLIAIATRQNVYEKYAEYWRNLETDDIRTLKEVRSDELKPIDRDEDD